MVLTNQISVDCIRKTHVYIKVLFFSTATCGSPNDRPGRQWALQLSAIAGRGVIAMVPAYSSVSSPIDGVLMFCCREISGLFRLHGLHNIAGPPGFEPTRPAAGNEGCVTLDHPCHDSVRARRNGHCHGSYRSVQNEAMGSRAIGLSLRQLSRGTRNDHPLYQE